MYLFRPAPIQQTPEIDIPSGERRKFYFAELGNSPSRDGKRHKLVCCVTIVAYVVEHKSIMTLVLKGADLGRHLERNRSWRRSLISANDPKRSVAKTTFS
jgi:hypothetical protein